VIDKPEVIFDQFVRRLDSRLPLRHSPGTARMERMGIDRGSVLKVQQKEEVMVSS
jgi:hypothetical protein